MITMAFVGGKDRGGPHLVRAMTNGFARYRSRHEEVLPSRGKKRTSGFIDTTDIPPVSPCRTLAGSRTRRGGRR